MLMLWGIAGGGRATGQSCSPREPHPLPTWQLVIDGKPASWKTPVWPLDSLHAVTQRALAHVQQGGYYHARIDSVATHAARSQLLVEIFVQKGPQIPVGTIRLEGTDAVPADRLRALMASRAGVPLNPAQLEADIDAMLAQYEAAGYPLAQIRVTETSLQSSDPPSLRLTLRVDEGPALWLKKIRVPNEARTAPRFVAHVAQLDLDAPLKAYAPERIRQRLLDTGLFQDVGLPELEVDDDGGAILDIPLEEKTPGTFDLVVGYLPPATRQTTGQLVGSGHLRLENLFGGGRTAGLAIDRRPGRVSTADVRLADPYLFGAPIRLEGRFSGEQRDSTYGKQAYHVSAGFILDAGTEVFGTLTREVTRPGQAGAALRSGTQQIPRSSAWFTGLGVRVRRLDRAVNPRRGFWVETTLERGQKTRRFRAQTADRDTTRQHDDVRQERLRLNGRVFVPTFSEQLIAWGIDAAVLRSSAYDRSDLFRLGGASTLRGYDEDRFLGNVIGRVLLEYRYQIDQESFAYLFGDLGFVATPARDEARARRQWHPGYGLGIQVSTDLGLIRASYALNPDDTSPTNGRIHLGLSFGL